MSAAELDELFFDDLGLRPVGSDSLVETDADGRTIAGVVDVDGVEVLVAADAAAVDRSAERVQLGLWLGLPILTALVAGLAWLLTSRALRPVAAITGRAATISGGSLDARVPVPDSRDEISTLAITVNEMLDRLEDDDRARRRFISDASHELRSPVAVMRNDAEVALEHPETTDVRRLASVVADESSRLSTIIDDLLALARHDEGVAPPADRDRPGRHRAGRSSPGASCSGGLLQRVGGTGARPPRRAHANGRPSHRQCSPACDHLGEGVAPLLATSRRVDGRGRWTRRGSSRP